MKFLSFFLASIITLSVSAKIQHAELETRHADLVEKSLTKACGNFRNLEVLSVETEIIRVDQGITDRNYKITLTGEQRMDQNIFDTYVISVESSYYDMYDHENKDWGAYSVKSVKCEMQ